MHAYNKLPRDYDLTCWYINARRVLELVGIDSIAPELRVIAPFTETNDNFRKVATLAVLKDALTLWLHQNNPPTLGQLLLRGVDVVNTLFTHYSNYYCKGSGRAARARSKANTTSRDMEIYSKLDEFREGQKVRFHFNSEHLTSNSAFSELRGQRRLLALGVATNATEHLIDAIPWVIADPFPNLLDRPSVIGLHWNTRLEIFVDQIDSFERVRQVHASRRQSDLLILRSISEANIKEAFADILGEPAVPKDWGGERSDLFTTCVQLDGERISTAFAFKGPAKFHPMTLADLGQNGDQVDRLFSEPADLLILQHCHEITPPVRGMMRAYAQQMGRPRLFCLIDGYDTIRILRAYGKCEVT